MNQNAFEHFFVDQLRLAGYKKENRGGDMYWRKPGERGIIYDVAEAVIQVIKDKK